MPSKGQAESRHAAGRILAVFQSEAATVSFGDLAAQHQADPGSALLGREEGHE
jgi:hypothetical protein